MSDIVGSRSASSAESPRTEVLLWTVFLVPLVAWMVQLFSLYMLEDFISCTPGSRTPGLILGIGVRTVALAITAILGVVTVATGILSLAAWRRMADVPSPHGDLSPARWMALAGVLNSLLFTSIIVIKAAPPLILGVCERAL